MVPTSAQDRPKTVCLGSHARLTICVDLCRFGRSDMVSTLDVDLVQLMECNCIVEFRALWLMMVIVILVSMCLDVV